MNKTEPLIVNIPLTGARAEQTPHKISLRSMIETIEDGETVKNHFFVISKAQGVPSDFIKFTRVDVPSLKSDHLVFTVPRLWKIAPDNDPRNHPENKISVVSVDGSMKLFVYSTQMWRVTKWEWNKETSNLFTDLEHKLRSEVLLWVDRSFNQISLSLVERLLQSEERSLTDYIEPEELDYEAIWKEALGNLSEDEQLELMVELSEELGLETDNNNGRTENEDGDEILSTPMLNGEPVISIDVSDLFDEDIKARIELIIDSSFVSHSREFRDALESAQESAQESNYPMWGTLFELKIEWATLLQNAPAAGFGVINNEADDDLNSMLFVSGCGYDFVDAHWIPLFLSTMSYWDKDFNLISPNYLKVQETDWQRKSSWKHYMRSSYSFR